MMVNGKIRESRRIEVEVCWMRRVSWRPGDSNRFIIDNVFYCDIVTVL